METVLESVPRTGRLHVHIDVTADMNISAFAAKQKANAVILNEISYMMHAGEPKWVVADKLYWRVPVIFSSPSKGDVGEVGSLDVNIETGQICVTPRLIAEIQSRAQSLAR